VSCAQQVLKVQHVQFVWCSFWVKTTHSLYLFFFFAIAVSAMQACDSLLREENF
jgi:hypothetical protein